MKYNIMLFAILTFLSITSQAESKPNIVYFLVDDLGYADCGFNGGKDIHTPNIDKLANDGAVLKSFYVQPVCSPTRAALMTGRYATHTGVYNVVRPGALWGLPLAERMLPQALREAGYSTAICGKWHLGEFQSKYTPTHRGFDHQYGHMCGAIDYFDHTRDGKPDWYRDDKPLVEKGYSTSLVAKEACRIIREQPADKPLFLYVPFNGIHGPHQVPGNYTEPYKKLSNTRRTIAGMLSAVDEAIGQITAACDEKGLRKDTLFIFSSDNGGTGPGTATMNTPLRAGKGTIYEGGIRVCAFATYAGKIPAGITIDEPIHAVDWYPTLLKLTGALASQELAPDGLDIWPVLTQGAKSPHEALLLPGMSPNKMALRMGDWKLLLNSSEKGTEESADNQPLSRKIELYNLAADIGEKDDLAAAHPEKVNEMRSRLDTLIKDAVPAAGTSETPAGNSKKVKQNDKPGSTLDIIDCHTHFYDPARDEGVPWPEINSSLYRTVLPKHLHELKQFQRVTGTVIVEASSRVEDNAWLLELAEHDPFIVGIVGRLEPDTPEFASQVKRFAADPLFRGIRISVQTLQDLLQKNSLDDLKMLVEYDLSLDVNGGPETPAVIGDLAERLPTLRIVLNHIGNVEVTADQPPRDWQDGIQAAAKHPNVFCKISALVEGASRDKKKAPKDLSFYRHYIDVVWNAFGDDRVIYGSNWPVSELAADYETLQRIVMEYAMEKGPEVTQKFCSLNAKRAYKWVERDGR